MWHKKAGESRLLGGVESVYYTRVSQYYSSRVLFCTRFRILFVAWYRVLLLCDDGKTFIRHVMLCLDCGKVPFFPLGFWPLRGARTGFIGLESHIPFSHMRTVRVKMLSQTPLKNWNHPDGEN